MLLTLSIIVVGQQIDWNRDEANAQIPGRQADFNFIVEIEGITAGKFAEVGGLPAEIEVIEYQDGDAPLVRKRPGRTKYSNITLKRGYSTNNDLFQWTQQVANGDQKRRSASLIVQNGRGEEVERWNLFECFPAKWNGLSQIGEGATLAIDKIEIAVERVERVLR